MRYLTRFLLLTGGFALTTAGLMMWRAVDFGFDGIWPFQVGFRLHGLHLLVLGLAMIPPALWEIFLLELEAPARRFEDPLVDG
jgi:hypothetical protein